MRLWAVALGFGFVACTGGDPEGDKPEDTGDAPVDAGDADADADADSDTDTDTDTDTDVAPSSFEAEILYQETLDNATLCSAEIELVGTPYTGACPDCEFAFEIDATLTSPEDPDCDIEPYYSWIADADFLSPRLAFSPSFTEFDPFERTFTNVLWFSADVELPSYYYYSTTGTGTAEIVPVWYMVAYDGHPFAQATFDGTNLEWSMGVTNPSFYQFTSYLDYCGYADYSGAGQLFSGALYGDDVNCIDDVLDVWEFEAQAGDPLRLSVDVPDETALFQPYLRLTDDTGCVLASSSGDFPCTGDPGYSWYGYYYYSYYCPSIEIPAPYTGTYRAVVYSSGFSSCPASNMGSYDLVLGPAAGSATQLADESPINDGPYEYELSVRMLGTAE